MALRWNNLDSIRSIEANLAARTLVATVTNVTDLGGGNGTVTISLRNASGQLHVPAANDEAVIDIMLGDSVLSPESALARFGGIVGAGAIVFAGGGTAHVQVVTQASEFTIAVSTTASRPEDCFIFVSQGYGSTYLVRAAQRWTQLTFGVS